MSSAIQNEPLPTSSKPSWQKRKYVTIQAGATRGYPSRSSPRDDQRIRDSRQLLAGNEVPLLGRSRSLRTPTGNTLGSASARAPLELWGETLQPNPWRSSPNLTDMGRYCTFSRAVMKSSRHFLASERRALNSGVPRSFAQKESFPNPS